MAVMGTIRGSALLYRLPICHLNGQGASSDGRHDMHAGTSRLGRLIRLLSYPPLVGLLLSDHSPVLAIHVRKEQAFDAMWLWESCQTRKMLSVYDTLRSFSTDTGREEKIGSRFETMSLFTHGASVQLCTCPLTVICHWPPPFTSKPTR